MKLLFFIQKLYQLILPPLVSAQTKEWVDIQKDGFCVAGPYQDIATIQGIVCLLANVLSITLTGIGLAGFIMMIVGSLKYMILGGSEGAKSAKGTMTYAVVGLVVALGAYAIMRFISEFTGIESILHFTLPSSLVGTPGGPGWSEY